jgi:hypothetical protein
MRQAQATKVAQVRGENRIGRGTLIVIPRRVQGESVEHCSCSCLVIVLVLEVWDYDYEQEHEHEMTTQSKT